MSLLALSIRLCAQARTRSFSSSSSRSNASWYGLSAVCLKHIYFFRHGCSPKIQQKRKKVSSRHTLIFAKKCLKQPLGSTWSVAAKSNMNCMTMAWWATCSIRACFCRRTIRNNACIQMWLLLLFLCLCLPQSVTVEHQSRTGLLLGMIIVKCIPLLRFTLQFPVSKVSFASGHRTEIYWRFTEDWDSAFFLLRSFILKVSQVKNLECKQLLKKT